MSTTAKFSERCHSDLETLRRARAAYLDATRIMIDLNQIAAFRGPEYVRQKRHAELVQKSDEAFDRLLCNLGDLELRGFMDRLEARLVEIREELGQ